MGMKWTSIMRVHSLWLQSSKSKTVTLHKSYHKSETSHSLSLLESSFTNQSSVTPCESFYPSSYPLTFNMWIFLSILISTDIQHVNLFIHPHIHWHSTCESFYPSSYPLTFNMGNATDRNFTSALLSVMGSSSALKIPTSFSKGGLSFSFALVILSSTSLLVAAVLSHCFHTSIFFFLLLTFLYWWWELITHKPNHMLIFNGPSIFF